MRKKKHTATDEPFNHQASHCVPEIKQDFIHQNGSLLVQTAATFHLNPLNQSEFFKRKEGVWKVNLKEPKPNECPNKIVYQ
jgi:hypothetical protein